MHYTNIGRSYGRKETRFFKTITMYQGRNTGMTIVRIPSTVEKGAEQRRKVLEEPYPIVKRGER
jgi:hypothetical protein